ncbi:MAG: DUF4173 domain-containing protein [Gammaproteobacteria bacterium]|nr:DUF4173 domain-containing protein [Gammaproteobacteria bacterium]
MNTTTDLATRILLGGIALGVAADYLLWSAIAVNERFPGPGLAVWITLLAAVSLSLNRHAELRWRLTVAGWSSVALAATLIIIFRGSPVLVPLMLLVLLISLAMLTLQTVRPNLLDIRIADCLRIPFRVISGLALGAGQLLGKVELQSHMLSPRLRGIARGLLIALPLLLVFIALFSSADATFERYAPQLDDLFSLATPRHLVVIAFFGWLATGLLSSAMRQLSVPLPPAPQAPFTLGAEEVVVIMGSLAALFLIFVLLQASYLFGGRETIEMTTGLTLAGYARRGFFEMVIVSGLTLVLLLSMAGIRCSQRLFRPLATVLVLCVLVILASAAQRLSLYTDAFGLTMARLTALAFMGWLTVNLISFTVTVLRGRIRGFASGMVLSGIATLLLLGLINPAALVARVNIDRALNSGSEGNRPIDVYYLATLGPDTIPILIEHFDALQLDTLPMAEQCQIAKILQRDWSADDWRSWNASAAKARQAFTTQAEPRLYALASGDHCHSDL